MTAKNMEELVALCKRRGFIFQSSEIYGGLQGVYDYGPLGVELKNNIKKSWWASIVYDRDDVEGLDASILTHQEVLKYSGHEDTFTDPLVDCKSCGERFRADQVPKDLKKEDLTEPRQFNLMFETSIGPVENENSAVYLRPETAQGIFVNFENVLRTMRAKIPFGIGNIGKSFRNEITPGQFIFRTREFEQMEIEFFCDESEEDKWFDYWVENRLNWYKNLGIPEKKLRIRNHEKSELAHYAKKTSDIEFEYPWGWGELEGIANRGNFDLNAHHESSGKDLTYFDPVTESKFTPSVIEPAGGLTRTLFAVLLSLYEEEELEKETRTFFKFNFNLAPIQIGILPLSKKEELITVCNEINSSLRSKFRTEIDITQSIGKRYRRQDEIGTPYCVTVDFDTLEDNSVTVRSRDTMEQERIKIEDLRDYFNNF